MDAAESERSAKAEALAVIQRLPDDCTYDEIQQYVEMLIQLEESEKDAAAGRVHTNDEVLEMLQTWLAADDEDRAGAPPPASVRTTISPEQIDRHSGEEGEEMGPPKSETLAVIERLPDDCTFEDIHNYVYLLNQLALAEQASKQGLVYTNEEARKLLEQWRRR